MFARICFSDKNKRRKLEAFRINKINIITKIWINLTEKNYEQKSDKI